ncbi:MAG TPA: hypothetical protein VE935_19920, partial [Burkholderiales bacterium]|nr:hypothetical protein [Burkholderiales bacterium]
RSLPRLRKIPQIAQYRIGRYHSDHYGMGDTEPASPKGFVVERKDEEERDHRPEQIPDWLAGKFSAETPPVRTTECA